MTDLTAAAEPIAAAARMAPRLAERAVEIERLRRLPDDVVAELRAARLPYLLQPAASGGLELPFGALIEVVAQLAHGCASTAWVLGNLASHSWMLGMWPPAAQREVWAPEAGGDPQALIAASLIFPAGHAASCDGGYRLRGRWGYASGIDHCGWVMLGAVVDGGEDTFSGATGEFRLFLLPRGDFRLNDNWFVAGLAGTGSKEVVVDDALVPEHRTVALRSVQGGATPGSAVNPGPLYRIPLLATFGYVVVGVVLGVAEATLELFMGENRHRLASYSGRPLTDYQSVQMRVAEASAAVESARRTLEAKCAEIMAAAASPEPPELLRRAGWRRDCAYAARLARQAVDLLFEASGGSALYLQHPLQRAFRDAHAGAAHIALNWDAAASIYGRVALGHAGDMLPFER